MAGRPGSPNSFSKDPNVVGNAFVLQYYNVLHQSPHVVHRFYTDQSKLSCAEAGANANSVATQDKIHDMIMSMDFGGIRAEIKTVDSQESLNGSVLVVVTGLLSSENGPDRSFVRTFFLAPQERGYFVLNDIFRYLNGESGQQVTSKLEEVAEEDVTEEIIDQGTLDSPKHTEIEADASPTNEDAPQTEGTHEISEKVEEYVAEETSEEEVTDVVPAHQDAPSKQLPTPEAETYGTAKLSYASVLRTRNESSNTSFVSRPSAPRKTSSMQSTSVTTQAAAPIIQVENTTETGSDGRSIYVRNLPLNITQEELENEFQKFGSLKPGGASLRNQKQGVCFAFIEFEDPSSAQGAIEASPIVIGGRQIYIEERKFMPTGSLGPRRSNQNWGYQNNGRGRGYSGGRGGGRGYNPANVSKS